MMYLGKRAPGSLTAVSPGDTLIFPFSVFNDSGASIALTGLAVTDIEVFKNGQPTARATDSGYSLISDTGMTGNRIGLYRCSIQLYNTADDSSFYAVGSSYQVAIDAVTIDGRTVRFWLGAFEIGYEQVLDTGIVHAVWANATRTLTGFLFDTGIRDTVWRASPSAFTGDTGSAGYAQGRIMAVRNDTGAAHLDQGRFGVISDSGRQAAVLDTGKVASAVWASHATRALTSFQFDTGVWGSNAARTLTAFLFDTGVADTVWKRTGRKLELDTGIAEQVWATLKTGNVDTGTFGEHLAGLSNSAGGGPDTGQIADAVWAKDVRTLTAFGFDTGVAHTVLAGVADRVWDESDTGHRDTGTYGRLRLGVNVDAIDGDTGPADNLGRMAGDTGTHSTLPVAIADTLLDRNMATGADNGSDTVRTPRQALRTIRNRVEMDTGTFRVFKEDDATLSHSGTLESDTGAVPIKTINPAGP